MHWPIVCQSNITNNSYGSYQDGKLVGTRTTSEQQTQANKAAYEARKEEKRIQREQKQQKAKMTSNLAAQTLLKSIQPMEKFTRCQRPRSNHMVIRHGRPV